MRAGGGQGRLHGRHRPPCLPVIHRRIACDAQGVLRKGRAARGAVLRDHGQKRRAGNGAGGAGEQDLRPQRGGGAQEQGQAAPRGSHDRRPCPFYPRRRCPREAGRCGQGNRQGLPRPRGGGWVRSLLLSQVPREGCAQEAGWVRPGFGTVHRCPWAVPDPGGPRAPERPQRVPGAQLPVEHEQQRGIQRRAAAREERCPGHGWHRLRHAPGG